jgi:uncharacterized protein (DUF983 family)
MPMKNTCPKCGYGYRQRSANSRCPKCGYRMTAGENKEQAMLYLVVVIIGLILMGLFKIATTK